MSFFLARQVESRALVLLTVSSEAAHDRFRVDTSRVGCLEHANILRVIDVGESEGLSYEALEYVGPRTLSAALCHGPLAASTAMATGRDLALALQYARDQGMVHRSLTPGAILLPADNGPKLSPKDFATLASMENGKLLGDPAFSPPERITGMSLQMTPATDVYRIGAVMYAMLTGQPPFVGDNRAKVATQVVSTPPVEIRRLNPEVPGDLDALCMKCLEKLPERRYATARHLVEAITCANRGCAT